MASQPLPKFTPEQYLEIERKAEWKSEYLNGEMFAMSGVSREHLLVNTNLTSFLHGALKGRPCEVYAADLRVLVSATSLYTYPDLTVVCGKPTFADKHIDTLLNPLVVIEILSPSTEAYDRGKKFGHYRALESLDQYVLVSQDEPKVEWYTRQPGGEWLFASASGLNETLPFPALDLRIPLAEVYRRIFPAVP